MILTVTLNTALDVTYRVDRLRPHGSNRVRAKAERAGGKGVNVARVLRALGREAVVTGFAGGTAGAALRRELAEAGLPERLLPIAGETRRTVAVVDESAGDTTLLLEPGPTVPAEDWERMLHHLGRLLPGAAAVVLSGSLPPGVPEDAYGRLVRLAHDHGVPAVVDADGAALRAALAAGPDLVKPNADELAAATGLADPAAAAAALLDGGAAAVVASLGPDGLIASTPQGSWRARPPRPLAGNPTGAGDAAVAALTLGLVDATPWPQRLAEAVALSAAAVRAPLAGDFDPDVHRRLRPLVDVRPLHPPRSA
ncbi:1-phosphofructokinase family hexose kinase [Streptomyces rubellomurinus]|uniref:Sugar kinase n=1 Tax=Streptomyces rubellomurinus (strain ATCC 31215) TaxID=359131 RepID=A0A0F2TEP3_STRR3|nr:hexose kinase [Streptomyces rubellomurinus]KJS60217.1 sugar kinase [Streptomyces rubellomurinus]